MQSSSAEKAVFDKRKSMGGKEMKKRILAMLLAVIMAVSLLPAGAFAADTGSGSSDPGVVFTKTILPATEASPAKIKLEAYTTGSTSSTESHLPTDIILVLDQSGSMDETLSGGTKLSVMKSAVADFVSAVAEMNRTGGGDLYRVAVVGFASESGYSDNTEILTATKSNTVTSTTYEVVSGALDTEETYYIRDGMAYSAITYREVWGIAAWYTTGRFAQRIDTSEYTVYTRKDTTSEVISYGVSYNNLTEVHYAGALINCTDATISASGHIGAAVAALDGNGATRTDLGLEIAAEIFAAQDYTSAANKNRQKVVVLITDGVPTTNTAFDSTVANNAVANAKEMKDAGAHIFSMYLGTPSAQSVNFLQAVSSNYPAAESISSLGAQAATSYYSAHTDPSAVQNMFKGIVNAISVNSTLNENSIVTDRISTYFKLSADLATTGTKQIEVYTVEKTASDWASEEVPFANATVAIGGTDNKTVSVTGFNFASHCVTQAPKDGTGGSDYGRKLVIYIPIVADPDADTFGGYLPTNAGAFIYQDASAAEPTISAATGYYNVPINYWIASTARAYHVHTADEYTVEYTPAVLNDILDEMLPLLPDGSRNTGVKMTYTLYDIGSDDMNNPNGSTSDDVKIASVTVEAGQSVDVSDFANWTLADANHTSDTIKIVSNNYAEKVYVLVCTLTSTNPTAPETKTVYGMLDIAVTNEDATHIVYGSIDAGGTLSVLNKNFDPTAAPTGTLLNNTYTEGVKEGNNSDIMTFKPNTGYEIISIKHRVLADEHLKETLTIYDINNPTAGILDAEGKYEFQAMDITGGIDVLVETRIKSFVLDTTDDDGSEILADTTYPYSDTPLNVPFRAIDGYSLTELTVYDANGTPVKYNLTLDADRAKLVQDYQASLTTAVDASGATIVTAGHISVPRTRNNTVIVTSAIRAYAVTLKYYIDNGNGTYTEQTMMQEGPTAVKFGTRISVTEEPESWPGNETLFSGATYTLSDWYMHHVGNEFYGLINLGAATMPANDLVLHAVWTKNPDVLVKEIQIEKKVVGTYTADSTFNFVASFHEQSAGTAEILIPANSSASANASMSIILTDAQYDTFTQGNGYIYIYELVGDNRAAWTYDNTRYELRWDATANTAVLYLNGAAVSDGIAVFTNTVKSHGVTVNYYIEGTETKLQNSYTLEAGYGSPYDVSSQIPASIQTNPDTNYTWVNTSGAVSGTLSGNVVVNVYYSLDNLDDEDDKPTGGDGIPDKYQALVTYAIQNGTWDGTSADSKIAVFTLYTKDAATGAWTKLNPAPTLGTSIPDVSGARPNAGFSNTAIWSPIPYTVDVPVHGAVYTYIFQPLSQELTLTFDANGGAWTAAVPEYTMGADNKTAAKGGYHFGDVIVPVPVNPTRDGYTFIGWSTQAGAKYWGLPGIVQNIYENVTLYAEWQADAPVPPAEKLEGELWINIQDENGVALADLIKIDVTESYLISATENADADYIIPAKITGYDGLNYIYERVVSGELSYTLTRKGEVVVVCLGYTLDELDDDEDKPNGGDNIPDKYQVVVTYRIVGGVWSDGTSADMQYVFTLREKNPSTGEWTVLSPAPVLGATIPTAKPSTEHTGEWDKVFDANTAVTASITYTYLMTALPKYTVSYDLRGGYGAPGVDYSPVTVLTGTQVQVKAAPQMQNAVFAGYAYNGKLYNPGDIITVTSDVHLVAQWNTVPPIIIVPGSVTLIKVDADDASIMIPNVSFSLYRANGVHVGDYMTNEAGRINVVGLNAGSYYWIETKAAEGYLLDSTPHSFTIAMGQNTQLTVTNQHSKVPEAFSGEHFAYIIGYTDGLVHPEGSITRAEVATIFFRLLSESTRNQYVTKYNNFVDVGEGMWFNVAVSTMAAMGIVNGYPDGTFRPNDNITRAEFAAIAARFDAHGNTTGVSFDDIYEHWAMKEINIAANNGWVLGYEDGTFKPDQEITRAESMALVNRVLQRIPENESDLLADMIKWPDNMDKTKWYYLTIQEATNSHDYARKPSGYEYWVRLKGNPDWTVWEK